MTYHGVEYVSFVELAKTIPVIHVGMDPNQFLKLMELVIPDYPSGLNFRNLTVFDP
jgi:hypothetical protein